MSAICDRKLKPKTDLGRRILLLCEAKGHKNLAEAARACGVHYQQLYQIVVGYRDPKWTTIERIVTGLGAGMGELFANDDTGEVFSIVDDKRIALES